VLKYSLKQMPSDWRRNVSKTSILKRNLKQVIITV